MVPQETLHPPLVLVNRWSLWPSGKQSMQKPEKGFWVVLLQMIHFRTIHARRGKFVWLHSKHQNQFVPTIMWSASQLAQMAPQASVSADKHELPTMRNQLFPERHIGWHFKGLCGWYCVWRAEWWDIKIARYLKYGYVARTAMNYSSLSTLLCMVFAFHLVSTPCGTLKGAGRDQPRIWNPFCSTLWTGFCLPALHTVMLVWCTMRCRVIILSLVCWTSGRRVSSPPGRVRATKFAGILVRCANG